MLKKKNPPENEIIFQSIYKFLRKFFISKDKKKTKHL